MKTRAQAMAMIEKFSAGSEDFASLSDIEKRLLVYLVDKQAWEDLHAVLTDMEGDRKRTHPHRPMNVRQLLDLLKS